MPCCRYEFQKGKDGESTFDMPVAVLKSSLPLVFSFVPSVNDTPVMLDQLYEPGMVMFREIHADQNKKTGKFEGIGRFERKGNKGGSKDFIQAERKPWTILMPELFTQEN